jgi:hypothetical protein
LGIGQPYSPDGYGYGNGGISYSSDRASDAATHQSDSQFSSSPYGTYASENSHDASQSSREHTDFNSAPNNVYYH